MMDAAERSMLQSTVDDALRDAWASTPTSAAMDDALERLGWSEMLVVEPRDAVEIVFGALGTINATAGALDDALMSTLGAPARNDLAVVLPPFASWDAPGVVADGHVRARGLATSRVENAGELLVVCTHGPGLTAVTVPVSAADISSARGVDPDGGLRVVQVDARAGNASPLDGAGWESTVALGRRAIARQIAGASRLMLDLARTHAVERVQFGRPVAGFQAVRHRLAEALVAVETLEAAVGAAWDEVQPETAALAKAIAGRTTLTVTAQCQQVLAGIGFTTDHPFHRYVKRTMTLNGIFGTADEIVLDIGRHLLATRQIPTLIEL